MKKYLAHTLTCPHSQEIIKQFSALQRYHILTYHLNMGHMTVLPHRLAVFPLYRAPKAQCGSETVYLNSLKHCTMFWTKQRHTTFPYWGSPPEHQINRKHFRLYYTGASDWWRCCLKQKWAIHRGEVMLLCRCWIWLNSTHAYTFLWGIVVFETSCSCNSLKCPLGSQRANKDTKKYIFLWFYVRVNMLTATACFYFKINPEWSIFFLCCCSVN